MAQKRRYAILGTGAIGGYYGGLLQQAGHEVHFLLRSDYVQVKNHGLRIDSVNGDFLLPNVNAHTATDTMPPCDVIVVALKTIANHILPELLPPLLKKESVVVMMQNGLGVEEVAAAVPGAECVLGALCFICSNKVGPGHIRHLDYGSFTLGEYTRELVDGEISKAVSEVAADFEAAGVTVQSTGNLARARWKKLVWNIPFNGLSVVLGATTDQLIRNSGSRALVERLMEEVCAGAASCGHQIDEQFIGKMIKATEEMAPYRPSMKIDFDEGRPMEIEAIYGVPLARASARGVALPSIQMLYEELRFLDANSV
jgi:2-dehydropantoate 2-reductase